MSDEERQATLNPAQAAAKHGYHPKTVLRALRRGELLGYQRAVNCTWRIYPDDLDRWIRGEQPKKSRRAA